MTRTLRRGLQESQDVMLKAITEKAFMAQVVQQATLSGWRVFHPYDSRRSTYGWPDLALCRPPRFILAELKTEEGDVSVWQREWGELLVACPGVEYYLWRPSNRDEIDNVLR